MKVNDRITVSGSQISSGLDHKKVNDRITASGSLICSGQHHKKWILDIDVLIPVLIRILMMALISVSTNHFIQRSPGGAKHAQFWQFFDHDI